MSKAIEALSPTDAAALEDALAGVLDDRYASAAQGAKADTAVQPGALGTAAGQAASAFATAEQGVKADRADGARQTMAKRIGLRSKIVGWAVPFYRVLADGSRLIIGGQRDDGVFYAPEGIFSGAAPSNPRRGSWGIFHIFDRHRVSAFSVMPDRKIRATAGLEATTLSVVMGQIDAAGGAAKARLTGNLGGYNHRPSTKAAHVAATMQTWLGPVDVDMPVSGVGNAVAITNLPYVVLSFSGQSNTLAGSADEDTLGDVITQNDVDFGLHLRAIHDPHRAYRGSVRRYSSSAPGGVAPYYTAGSIIDMQPAGQDAEVFGIYTWLPDLVQFSIIHLDQMMAQSQAVYLQMTSAQGSTPITDYLPGQVRGDNITGFITGAQDMILSKYGKKTIGPAHFMVGHEDAAITGYASYSDALGAMADHVCGKLNALQGNVDAGLSAKLITYQANQSRGAVDGKTFASGGTLDTHTRSLTDNRIINIGGVYDERTADGGIHMRGKFSTALKMAYAFVMWWRFGVRVQAPYIASAVWDGNVTITATIAGMVGPLMEDRDWLPPIPDGGLFYDDDDAGAPPAITGVKIVNTMDSGTSAITRQLVITLASPPVGANKKLYAGGRNNDALTDWSGGLTSYYVPGIPNFWFDKGFGQFCTPDLRWRLAPAIIPITNA